MPDHGSEPRPSGYADEVLVIDVEALAIIVKRDVSCKLQLEYALEILFLRARLREVSRLAVDGVDPEAQHPQGLGPHVRRVK